MSDLSDTPRSLSHQDMMDLNEIFEKDKQQNLDGTELELELSGSEDLEIDLDSDENNNNESSEHLDQLLIDEELDHSTTDKTNPRGFDHGPVSTSGLMQMFDLPDIIRSHMSINHIVDKLVPTMLSMSGTHDGAIFVELGCVNNVANPDTYPIDTTDHSSVIIEECVDESEESLEKPEPPTVPTVPLPTASVNKTPIKPETSIILNVGGKLIRISKSILAKMNVNYGRLKKYTLDDKTVYFLDRDPVYFNKITEAIKIFGADSDSLTPHLGKFSHNLISELCLYNLVDKKLCPKPKLKLKRLVGFPDRHNRIVTILVNSQRYETFTNTLTRSTYLENRVKSMMPTRSTSFVLDADPDVFRYVLNLMRSGVLHSDTEEIRAMLVDFGIEFIRLENKSTLDTIVTNHVPYIHYPIADTISTQRNIVSAQIDPDLCSEEYAYCAPRNYSFVTDFCSTNTISPNPNTKLVFDSPIKFDLTSGPGDAISSIVVCVDLPVLNPIEKAEYVDMLEFKLLDYAVITHKKNNQLLFHTTNELIYLFPMIYKSNYSEFHKISRSSEHPKTKVLYNGTLIDVHRTVIPLYMLDSVQNHLPVKRLRKNSHCMTLELKIASLKKILKHKLIDIPLLNVSLNVNYLNFPIEHPKQLYLYTRWISIKLSKITTDNTNYDLCTVPLSSPVPRLIKDFFFVVVDKSVHSSNILNRFNDKFIELEIIRRDDVGTSATMCKLDTMFLSTIIPLQKLGHALPSGMYYYSFSVDPTSELMLGSLPTYPNSEIEFQFKIKKSDSVIKLFIREYVYQFY